MQNPMVMFILSFLYWKYPFWANLVKKIRIVSLSWNLVLWLIRVWTTHSWCSFFSVFNWKCPFLGNLFHKYQNCWSWNIEPRLIRIYRTQWWFSLFFFFLDWKYPFCINLVQKFKIVSLGWYLSPRLLQIDKKDGDVHFFVLDPCLQVFSKNIIWC